MVEVKRHSDASRNIVEPIRRLGNIVTSIKCRDRGNVTTNASSGVAWRHMSPRCSLFNRSVDSRNA
jgi:hypothetical protein